MFVWASGGMAGRLSIPPRYLNGNHLEQSPCLLPRQLLEILQVAKGEVVAQRAARSVVRPQLPNFWGVSDFWAVERVGNRGRAGCGRHPPALPTSLVPARV